MPLALLLAAALLAQSDPQADGLKALEARDYPAAAAAFSKAVEADPEDYYSHFHLGLALSLSGNASGAIASYRKTLELNPGLYEAELNLGIVLLEAKQASEAAAILQSAAGKKPVEFRPVYYLAEALLAKGDYAGAEKHFLSAAGLDNKSAAAQSGLGRAIARQNRLKEAEAALRQAAALDPAYRDGLLELASLYEKAKRPEPAIALYHEFLDDVAVRERLGELYLDAGQPGKAVEHLEKAAAQSPSAANRFALATAYLRNKEPGKAAAMMDQALASDPDNATLRLSYAALLRDQKNFPGAAQQYWRVAQTQPDSKAAWTGLATMLLSLENYTQALAAFDKLEALGDPETGLYFLRALAYDRTKQYQPALVNYEKFLSLSQDKHPDEEFKARQRIKVIKKELSR
ncbi:MAG: tetratricopeptide repeat protein [Acidimicrobiia bacterium]|nr:tetratricopeptide repeat protein [Acidimicrobiia bacterium]